MIKINLLPVKRKKKKKPKPVPTFVIVGVLFLTVSVIAGLYYDRYFLKGKISSLEGTKKNNEDKIAELNKKIVEVKDFEKLNKTFTDRKNIIEQLRKNQSLPVRILDEMSSRLTDGVWLTSMTIDGGNISLDGVGFSNTEVVTFVQSLKESPLYKEVYLHGTDAATIEKIEVFKFKITLQVQA